MDHSQIVSFIWSVADLIRDTFKRGKYPDVILPFTVLRRLDCVMAPTKARVLERYAQLKGRLADPHRQLCRASGFAFYNTSRYDFARLLTDPPSLAVNLEAYIAGFSRNMAEVLHSFRFNDAIRVLDEGRLLYQVVQRFGDIDLHPDKVDNATMGMVFEELIRKFNESLNENPGEHFTPRDVVHLMVDLMLAGDEDHIARQGAVHTIYDPCCGSGGMLMIARDHITRGRIINGNVVKRAINPAADIHLFGQETNPETWAIARSDLYIKDPKGRDAENIKRGSVLREHHDRRFDYLITNPPYGKDWTVDRDAVKAEHERGSLGRFGPGLPRINDGQLLFLLHLLSRMRESGGSPGPGGSRVAVIMNGSPLFSGNAGGGESEIRRYVLENDLLEAIIALPEQLFYNTGIATYVWLLTNRKTPERQGLVQLIDATSYWVSMRRSLGDKRREIPHEQAAEILLRLTEGQDGAKKTIMRDGQPEEMTVSRILPTTEFGYRRVTVERPLRLNFQASQERIARLDDQAAFRRIAVSRKKGAAGEEARRKGRELQGTIRSMLSDMPDTLHKDADSFGSELAHALTKAGIALRVPTVNAIIQALSEKDETAEVFLDRKGNPVADSKLRDHERVPLLEGDDPVDERGVPASVQEFFDRQVSPYRPDAWINEDQVDKKDGHVGTVGYEINFTRYFYRFRPPRAPEEVERDIVALTGEIVEMLKELTTAEEMS